MSSFADSAISLDEEIAEIPESDWGEYCRDCGWCDTPGACVAAMTCPHCGSAPRSLCTEPGSGRLTGYHRERHHVAAQLRASSPPNEGGAS